MPLRSSVSSWLSTVARWLVRQRGGLGSLAARPAIQKVGRITVLAALVALAATYAWHVLATFGGHTIDDAGITYAYADNLAHGRGLRLTAHEAPAEGFSNPLQVLLLALFARFANLDPVAKAINVLFATGGLSLLGLFVYRQVRGAWRMLAVLPILLAFNWPGFNYWMAAGLEGGMLVGLQMAALVALARAPDPRADAALGVFAGLLVWVRPEAGGYGAIAVALRLLVPSPERGRRTRALRIFGLLAALLLVLRLLVFRDLVPNTFWAKVGGHRDAGLEWGYVTNFFINRWWYFVCGLPVMAFAARGRYAVVALAATGQILFAFAFSLVVGGDWMREWRFLQPVMGPLALLVALGLTTLVELAVSVRTRVTILAAMLLPSFLCAFVPPGWLVRAQTISKSRDIDMRVLATVAPYYRRFGEKLRLPRPLFHVDVDAGGVSYRSGLDIIDMSGLSDRVLARGWTRESGLVVDYLFGERRPDTIHLHGSWEVATPVHRMSPFALYYRAFENSTLNQMLLGAITAVRADLLDPLAAPVARVTGSVGEAVIEGVSAVPVEREYALFVHARQAAVRNPAPPVWVSPGGRRFQGAWHAAVAVAPGPVGAPLLAMARVPADALPLTLEGGGGIAIERWPLPDPDLGTIEGLSRLALVRRAGGPPPACDPDRLLDPAADAPSRARGVAFVSDLCGGLSPDRRRHFADGAWAAARAARDPDDRYEAAVAGFRLGLPQDVGQRLFVERARREHQRYDELLVGWAERDLAAPAAGPVEIGRGLRLMLAARQPDDVVLRAVAHGWTALPEARDPLCAAVRRLGLRPTAITRLLTCEGVTRRPAIVTRQSFEDSDDPSLHFSGASRRWLTSASQPTQRAAGGQGGRFLASGGRTVEEATDGEVIWGPFPFPGRRFGALAGGAPAITIEVQEGARWTVVWNSPPTPFASPMIPIYAELGAYEGRATRVKVTKAKGTKADLLVDALTFVDVSP